MTQGDQIVGVSDQHRGARRPSRRRAAPVAVADPGGCFHPVQSNVQQQRADHPALRSSLLGRGEPAVLDHARLQPLRDQSPGGERAELRRAGGRGRCGRTPPPGPRRAPTAAWALLPLQRRVDRLDRVVAAAARPEPVGPRLEPRLPLGLQRVDAPGPAGTRSAITGIPSGRCFPFAFGMYTRLTGRGCHGAAPVLHPVGQLGLRLRRVSATSPVDPGRLAASVDAPSPAARSPACCARERSINFCRLRTRLRSPACDAVKIRCRSRRTSSSTGRQSIGVPVEGLVLRSVHPTAVAQRPRSRHRRPTCPSVPASSSSSLHRLTWPTSAPFRVRARGPYPAGYPRRPAEEPAIAVPVSRCLSAAGIRFLGHPAPAGEFGLPHGRPTETPACARTPTGFPRSTRSEIRPGWVPSVPRGRRCSPGRIRVLRPAPAASQRPVPTPRCHIPSAGLTMTRHQRGFTHVHPSGLPLACSPRMEREPLGFHPGLRTPPLPATHARAGTGHRTLARNYTIDISRPSNLRVHSTRATSCRTPASEYYDGSAPSRRQQRTLRLPLRPAGRRPGRAAPDRFPRSLVSTSDGIGARLHPDGIALTAVAVLARASRRSSRTSGGSGRAIGYSPPSTATRPIHQIRQAADSSRGFIHRFTSVTPLRPR